MTEEARAIARIEAQIHNLCERWDSIEPLLLARSGDLQRFDRIERDINSVGAKAHGTEARVDAIERRIDCTFWTFLGASAVLQSGRCPHLPQLLLLDRVSGRSPHAAVNLVAVDRGTNTRYPISPIRLYNGTCLHVFQLFGIVTNGDGSTNGNTSLAGYITVEER